jgi:hypothetical protein
VITQDGFEVNLSESLPGWYRLQVVKVIKYGQTKMLPAEVIDDDEFLTEEIKILKQHIEEKINGNT